ncbi:MAG: glycosyltransferase family 39 protein [Kofleriaceae bacterium]
MTSADARPARAPISATRWRHTAWLAWLVAAALVIVLARSVSEPALARLRPAPLEAGEATAAGALAAGARELGAWTGSLALPRGGPYILGFLSSGPARLRVGPHEVTGRGLVTRRVLFAEAGPVALRFVAPAGARLLWSPPGRRGPPEYVPPSSLSPLPPAQATFGADAGTAPARGAVAAAGLLLLIAALGWAARRRLAQVERATWLAMAAVLAGALLVRLIGLGDAGQTWDEDVYWSAGRNYVDNVLAGDLDDALWRWNAEHPPVTKYLAGIAACFADGYQPARAVSALLGALACALLVPIGARLASRTAGVLAGAIAALTPHLLAHSQVVGHEAPSLLWWTAGMCVALELAPRHPDAAPRTSRQLLARLVPLGVLIGLAAATRFIGGLLGPAALVVAAAAAPAGQRRRVVAWTCAVAPAVALAVFVAVWPRLWSDPLGDLWTSWGTLRRPHAAEPFAGVLTSHPPWSYFFQYLIATAPIGLLAAALVGLAHLVRTRAHLATITLAAWGLAPLVVSFSPVRQDGVRYILPSVAALSLAAGIGLAAASARLPRRGVAWGVRAALLGYLAIACARVRPYYLDYFGELVGGAGAVSRARRFETAWWGEGLDRAIAYVNQHAAPGAIVHRGCVAPSHLTWFRGDLWAPMTHDARAAEWIVVYAPATAACPLPPAATQVFSVTSQGAVLVSVFRNAR